MKLDNPIFTNENKAEAYIERLIWGGTPFCPHCGSTRVHRMKGKTQAGMFQCNDCRDKFTVRTNTVMARSHIPLHKWLLAYYLLCSSKKGISAHQLHRMLGITYRSAWFLAHRIREAMREGDLAPFGSGGGTVEADETFIGRIEGKEVTRGGHHKMKVLSLVDRDSGQARSMVVDNVTVATLVPILKDNIAKEASVCTDDASAYRYLGQHFARHGWTRHSKGEYVHRLRPEVHSNTVEGYFSIFKRGMKGVYQHCGERHLHRYLAEFDFRYSHRTARGIEDAERAMLAVQASVGKRLMYRAAVAR